MCVYLHTHLWLLFTAVAETFQKNSLEVESHTPKTQIVYLVKKIVSICDVKFQLYF